MNKQNLLTLTILMLMLVSCNKDEEPSPGKSELLAGKKWIYTALTTDPPYVVNGVSITDLFAHKPPCSKDDFIQFNTSGDGSFNEGSSKCDETDPQTIDFTWSLISDQKYINFNISGIDIYYEIVVIEEDYLKVTFPEKDDNTGIIHMITAEFEKFEIGRDNSF